MSDRLKLCIGTGWRAAIERNCRTAETYADEMHENRLDAECAVLSKKEAFVVYGNKIVLDLEFTPIQDVDLQAVAGSEVLEIGAVKLGKHNEKLEEFQTYVKPQYSTIPEYVTRITGIDEATVADAPEYAAAIRQFTEWVDPRKPSRFYTWSNTDRYVLLREADLKEYPLDDLFYTHWMDLQRIHQRLYGFSRPMNLTSALGSMQIDFKGTEHGALADARNTAKLLRELSSVSEVRRRIQESRITYNGKESHDFPLQFVIKNHSKR